MNNDNEPPSLMLFSRPTDEKLVINKCWPNGAVERFIQTLKKSLQVSARDGLSLLFSLAHFLLQYRLIPHATTAAAPSSLFLGRKLRTRLDLLHPSLERQVRDCQVSQKVKHDSHAQQRAFEIGDEWPGISAQDQDGYQEESVVRLDHISTW